MNLELSAEAIKRQQQWRDFATTILPLHVSATEENHTLSDELLAKVREEGLLHPFLPTALGGADLDLLHLTLMSEELGRTFPALSLFLAQQVILGIWSNPESMTFEQRQELAEKAANLDAIFALAVTEDEAGSDLSLIETRCCRTSENTLEVSGRKALVSWARRADFFLVLARSEDGPTQNTPLSDASGKGPENPGPSLILVPARHPSMKIGPDRRTMGLNGLEPASIEFSGIQLPAAHLTGNFGKGLEQLEAVLNRLRLAVSATATGMAQQAFDDAAQHGKSRKQFDKVVGGHQSLQWRFADAATKIDAGRLHIWQAVEYADNRTKGPAQTAMAKIFTTEAACEIVDFAVQVLGGRGYLHETNVERLYRDARYLKIGWGTSEILRNRIAEYL